MQPDLSDHLQRLEERLAAIERNTETTWWQLLMSGLLRGAGIILGTALTIVLAGWGLAILGVIPGADELADYLAGIITDANAH